MGQTILKNITQVEICHPLILLLFGLLGPVWAGARGNANETCAQWMAIEAIQAFGDFTLLVHFIPVHWGTFHFGK